MNRTQSAPTTEAKHAPQVEDCGFKISQTRSQKLSEVNVKVRDRGTEGGERYGRAHVLLMGSLFLAPPPFAFVEEGDRLQILMNMS
jgi:hypothetical protein